MARWWQRESWRQVQTNLRQIDMIDMNADEYVRQMQSFGASVAMINVAGILASYPTDLPYHFQSPYLQGDSLAKVVDACHQAGIRVVARTDFSKVRRPIYEQHPDWAFRTASGDIVDYNGDVHACVCGGFQQQAAFEILREVFSKLPLDGLFMNMGGFQTSDYSYRRYGLCHCDNCKRMFREYAGMDLPKQADMADPAYRRYRAFQREVTQAQKNRIVDMVHGINPEIAINETDFFRMESNTEYGRPLPYWQYSASSNTRCLRGTRSDRVVSNTTVDFIGFYYRHVAVDGAQQKLRMWQNIANLGSPDYYLIGRLDNHLDRSGYDPIREVFLFHKKHADTYMGLASVADVLLMRDHHWGDGAEERGWIRVLTEAHILFDEAMEPDLLDADLTRYRAVILPGNEVISDALAEKLDAYVKNGGKLIVSGEAGRYDGMFEPRPQSPFACLGIRRPLGRDDRMVSAMFLIGDEERAAFPSLPDTEVVMLGDTYLHAEYAKETRRLTRMIAPQDFGPPERCYHTTVVDFPGVTAHPYGKGIGIRLPWLPGTVYQREGYGNTRHFMTDVLTQIAGIPRVSDALTPMVEVTLGIKPDGSMALVQFVNNSGHYGTSYLAPVPVPDVRVTVPCAGTVKQAVSLVDGRAVPFAQQEGRVTLEVGTVGEFESVKLVL